jgi:hypothetical protein
MSQSTAVLSKRANARIKPSEDIWAYWLCQERANISRVWDISVGGLLLETSAVWPVGSSAQLEFLVREGQIRAAAIVRRIEPGRGLGLKFVALRDEDRPRLIALMHRLRTLSQSHPQKLYESKQNHVITECKF